MPEIERTKHIVISNDHRVPVLNEWGIRGKFRQLSFYENTD